MTPKPFLSLGAICFLWDFFHSPIIIYPDDFADMVKFALLYRGRHHGPGVSESHPQDRQEPHQLQLSGAEYGFLLL